jgi:hypothetical protein
MSSLILVDEYQEIIKANRDLFKLDNPPTQNNDPVKELTDSQKDDLKTWQEIAINLGLSTADSKDSFEKDRLEALTNVHRELFGIKPTNNFVYFDSPFQAYKDPIRKGELKPDIALYGSMDGCWLGFYNYCRMVLGKVKETDMLVPLWEIAHMAGWIWMDDDLTIITQRPKAFRYRREGSDIILGSEDELAIEYFDGNGVIAVDGNRLAKGSEEREAWEKNRAIVKALEEDFSEIGENEEVEAKITNNSTDTKTFGKLAKEVATK